MTSTSARSKVKVLCVAGARPNFVKTAALMRAFHPDPLFDTQVVHTGQHYDPKLSSVFFDELEIPVPTAHLRVGSGSHAWQTAELMKRFEPVLSEQQPQVVLVVGDVNSTLACALVASKFELCTPFGTRLGERRRPLIAHVEAGLRSFDPRMPEEINRRLTDALADVLYVSEPAGVVNLANEGISGRHVVFVGNVLIDSLRAARGRASQSGVLSELGMGGAYGVLTLHRPGNVDDDSTLLELLRTLDQIALELPIVFPVHPRTRQRLRSLGWGFDARRWRVLDPLGYFDFVHLLAGARVVFTDSGGIQEETTALGIPCLTLRDTTERPVTVERGTNSLVGTKAEAIENAFRRMLDTELRCQLPEYWDGKAATRIVSHLRELLLEACPDQVAGAAATPDSRLGPATPADPGSALCEN